MATQLQSKLLAEEEKLLACIHCGLCLEACPTYVATGDENDGPRGRLYLMRAVGEGRLANTSKAFANHIDRCLGCRACEQVCPAGVEYGQLLEASRAELRSVAKQTSPADVLLGFFLKRIWPHPSRLRKFFRSSRIFRDSGIARLLLKSKLPRLVSQRLEFALAMLVSSAGDTNGKVRHAQPKLREGANLRVDLFTGCVGEGLFARVNRATARVLTVNGFELQVSSEQVCCGALHAHAGDLEGAKELARQNIKAFGADNFPIVTNAGGCGAMLTTYGHLLTEDPDYSDSARKFSDRVRDIGQLLQTGNVKTGVAPGSKTVTYDASCHLMYGQHAAEESLQMLTGISGLSFSNLEGSERCCGGAGIYNLLQAELSQEVLSEKLKNIRKANAEVLATGNPGCQMQIAAGALLSGMQLKVCHPVEILDEAYAKAGIYEEDQ